MTEFRDLDLAIADQCRLNLLWLDGRAGGERALEIEVPELRLTEALSSLYGHVDRLPCGAPDVTGNAVRLPFPDRTFDLVTLYGRRPSQAALGEIRRVLRTGGTALLATENRWWYGRLREPRRPGAGRRAGPRLPGALRAAGFRDVHPYWVEPSLAIPRNLVPARADRVAAFEAIRVRERGPDAVRAMAVRAGAAAVLYPAIAIVAEA